VTVACDENGGGGAPRNDRAMTVWRLAWRLVSRLEAWSNDLRRLNMSIQPARARASERKVDLNMGGSHKFQAVYDTQSGSCRDDLSRQFRI
jgi:hypothetical protein